MAESGKRPNILWFCSDAQRWDTIGALGNPHVRTPNLDRLVRHGTAFSRAYAQSTICTPSRASMMTGRYPASTHVYRNGNAYFPSSETLISKRFAEAGYDCGLVGKLHMSTQKASEQRYDDGYRYFEWSSHQLFDEGADKNGYFGWLREEKGFDPHELLSTAPSFLGAGVPEELSQAAWAAEKAIAFITQNRDGPWLLNCNPVYPHPPFDPPADYLNRYDPDSLPSPLFQPSDLERQKHFSAVRQQAMHAVDPRGDDMPPELGDKKAQASSGYQPPSTFAGRRIKAAYYAMIELLDAQFGRILDALEETGQIDNTIIVYNSDHGELLGDHGLIFKGCRFFEGAVHVPLIVSWPGRIIESRQSEALVELVDIAPTLLETAGIPVPSAMQGKSLLPLLMGAADDDWPKTAVVSDFNDSVGYSPVDHPTQATMTFDGRFKLIVYHRHPGLAELFDLENDPGEFENLWDMPGLETLKLHLLRRHMDRVMETIWAGPERVNTY